MKIINNILNEYIPIRTEKDFPKQGIEFIDITPCLMTKDIYSKILNKLAEEARFKEIDYIVSPEARGFIFGAPVAQMLGVGFIPVRKKGKLPPTAVRDTIEYEKEYGKDIMEFPKEHNMDYTGKNFYVIDDIYATGSTASSIKKYIESIGGNVKGIGVLIDIIELNNDKEVFSIMDINEE